MKRRKSNIYFDRKSLGFKLGKKPPTKAQKAKQRAIARQDRRHEKIAEREGRKQAKKQAGGLFRQIRREGQREVTAKTKAKFDKALFDELYGRNPRDVGAQLSADSLERAAKKVQELWRKSGIYQPVDEAKRYVLEMRDYVGKKLKKKNPRKRKRNRKGKMPAGLRKYWAKKRAKKRKRNSRPAYMYGPDGPRKAKGKAQRRKVRSKERRTMKRVRKALRVRNYRKPARRRNPPRKRRVRIIKTSLRKGTKAFRQFVAQTRAKYGSARVL
jgi:hypothetical protein